MVMQLATPTVTEKAEGAGSSRAKVQLAGSSAVGQTSPRRNQSLDVLRCIAILLVLGCHVGHYRSWSRFGWIGVDLFFVLSGFLVSGLLFQEFKDRGEINFRRFILRRGLKIWPAFYVYIAVTAALVAVIQIQRGEAFPWSEFIVASLFLRNYFPNNSPFFAHIWSLAVEEHFYLLLPMVLALLSVLHRRSEREPFRLLPLIFAGAAIVCLGLRLVAGTPAAYLWETHLRIDSLFGGVTLAYFYHFRQQWFERMTGHYALIIATLCCIPAVLLEERSRTMQTFGLTTLFVGFSFLVAWAVVRSPNTYLSSLAAKVAARIGFYSYSIYLWHRLLAFVFSPKSGSAAAFWIYMGLAIMVGISMSKLVEMPVLRLREKWKLTA
jgi:peptidoglycan/LPS O-acetylase OafA/YrhL